MGYIVRNEPGGGITPELIISQFSSFLVDPPPMTVRIPINVMPWSESSMIFTGAHPQFLQGGAPKIAKLVYNSNNYGL